MKKDSLSLRGTLATEKSQEPRGETVTRFSWEINMSRNYRHSAYGRRATARASTRTIQDVACCAIRAGRNDEEALAEVHTSYPAAKTTLACIRWYRSLLNTGRRVA